MIKTMIIALVLVDIPVKSFTKEQVSAGFIKLSWHQCDERLIFFHANTLTLERLYWEKAPNELTSHADVVQIIISWVCISFKHQKHLF